MKRMRFLLGLSLALVIGKSCDATFSPIRFDRPTEPRSSKLTADTISKGFTKLTLDLDKAIDEISSNEVKNVVLSPASLTATLAILLLASSGDTFNKISKALHVDSVRDIYENSENVHIALRNFMRRYDKKATLNQTMPICKTSTGLFIQDGYPFHKEFIKASRDIYGGDVINVDFAQNSKNAQDVINKWTSIRTVGKVPKVLSEPPSEDARIIVLSAIYFNGMWDKEFAYTYDRFPFKVESGETIRVPMMMQTATSFPYFEIRNQLQILGLPYKGLETVMYVIRPHASGTNGLRNLKRRLTPEILDRLIEKMKDTELDVGIPKMKLSSNVNLQEALSALNLTSLFDLLTADFSIISPGLEKEFVFSNSGNPGGARDFGIDKLRKRPNLKNPNLFLESINHAVNLQIDEKGTVATAATSAVISINRASRPMFYANKPFLFFIRHNPTKSILFWGSINRPTNE